MKSTKFETPTMKKIALDTLLISALLGLAACASSTANNTSAANPQAGRITDERMLAERKALDSLQTRLKVLNEAGVPIKSYTHAKAQCWLDSAKTQYHENDRTGYVEEAMEQSISLIRALETDKTKLAASDTPLISKSDKVRDDLWARFAALKAKPGFACVEQIVACNEVRLVRAGHANEQTGWRQASPHIAMVEDALLVAERDEAACKRPSVVVVPKEAAPVPAVAASAQRFVLLSDTLFKFDKSGRDEMLPAGRARLQKTAETLRGYQRIDSIKVVGFTDRLGSDAYNNALSARRADTVRAFLQSLGVNAPSFSAVGEGKSKTVSAGCPDSLSRVELEACLQPDRRVELEVTGIVK